MIPEGIPKAVLSTTLAVLRATPGSVTSSAMVRGTSPPKRRTSSPQAPWMALALFR